MTRKKKVKAVKAWGGFTDGKLDWRYEYASCGEVIVYATYRTKAAARRHYRDVRPVEIRPLPKPKPGRK